MVLITAELGPTWMGDYHTLFRLMKGCKDAGIDAVKLQAFDKPHLNSRYWRIKGAVTVHNIDEINSIAKEVGIRWYCTPCSESYIDWIAPYVNMWKIRYRDQTNYPLINKILDKKQTMLISTNEPDKWRGDRLIHPIYCINKYPTPVDDVDLERMKEFHGYSCHTPVMTHIMLAVGTGIKFLEIHVTPDRTDRLVVDNSISFQLNELPDLVDRIRIWAEI